MTKYSFISIVFLSFTIACNPNAEELVKNQAALDSLQKVNLEQIKALEKIRQNSIAFAIEKNRQDSILQDQLLVKAKQDSIQKSQSVEKSQKVNKPQTGTFTDSRDGKTYKWVKIGTQIWMAENLAYKSSSGCWAYDNNQNNVSKYGYLYDWETAKNVCPSGWHLPSNAEWTTMIEYLGGEQAAYYKMKATSDWKLEATMTGTNISGFNALPAGYKDDEDGPYGLGTHAMFWSSTPAPHSNYAWACWFFHNSGATGLSDDHRVDGYSVRCVKD